MRRDSRSWLMAHRSWLMAHRSSLIPHHYPFLLRRGSRGAPPPPPALRPTLSTPKGLLAKAVPRSGFGAVESPASFALARAALAFLSFRALAFLSFSRSRLLMTSFRGGQCGGCAVIMYAPQAQGERIRRRSVKPRPVVAFGRSKKRRNAKARRHGGTKARSVKPSRFHREWSRLVEAKNAGTRSTEGPRHRGAKASPRLAAAL